MVESRKRDVFENCYIIIAISLIEFIPWHSLENFIFILLSMEHTHTQSEYSNKTMNKICHFFGFFSFARYLGFQLSYFKCDYYGI